MGDQTVPLSSMSKKNVILKSAYASQESGLNFCHFNACSLYPRLTEMKVIFKNIPFHVIAVSESWLNSDKHTDKLIELPGYKVCRRRGW